MSQGGIGVTRGAKCPGSRWRAPAHALAPALRMGCARFLHKPAAAAQVAIHRQPIFRSYAGIPADGVGLMFSWCRQTLEERSSNDSRPIEIHPNDPVNAWSAAREFAGIASRVRCLSGER